MTPRRRGMTLLMVIVLIGAMGVFSVLLARTLAQTWNDSRRAELAVRARQLLASAVEWTRIHSMDVAALKPGQTRDLDVSVLAPPGGSALAVLSFDESSVPPRLHIRCEARLGKIAEVAAISLPMNAP